MVVVTSTYQKGCLRRVTRCARRASLHALAFVAGGVGGTSVAVRAAPPNGIENEYAQMIASTPLRASPPALEFYEDLHGVGGLFDAQNWAILVGIRDMCEIAASVISRWPKEVATLYLSGRPGFWPTAIALSTFAFDAAVRRCVAHELGHALRSWGASNPYAPDDEAGADYYAGRLDAACGRSRDLGEMFFYAIGCVGESCDHPSPPNRAAAYGAGFDAQAMGMAG
jgi:hypothetical protein